jgi:hypothetical protein
VRRAAHELHNEPPRLWHYQHWARLGRFSIWRRLSIWVAGLPAFGRVARELRFASPASRQVRPHAGKAQLAYTWDVCSCGVPSRSDLKSKLRMTEHPVQSPARRVGITFCFRTCEAERHLDFVQATMRPASVTSRAQLFFFLTLYRYLHAQCNVISFVVLHRTQHYRSVCSPASNAALPVVLSSAREVVLCTTSCIWYIHVCFRALVAIMHRSSA